jgi:Tol biopolymer transport system component
MNSRKTYLLASVIALTLLLPQSTRAEEPALPETPLGTVDVTGAAGGGVVLQKLNVVLSSQSQDAGRGRAGDEALLQVVRNDLRLSGQFDVEATSDFDIVVRVASEDTANVTELTGEITFPKSGKTTPAFSRSLVAPKEQSRLSAHKLSDALLGALTGTLGAFASQLTFVARAGTGQQVFVADADGFGLRAYGPENQVALSPDFGPGGSVYYALSTNQGSFRFTEGETAQSVSWPIIQGNLLGLAFAADRKSLALTVSNGSKSELIVRAPDGATRTLPSPPNAHHPAFGPQNRLAWVAGNPPRVIVDGAAVSPAGIPASSPTFCESPQGLLLVFALSNGKDSAIYASDPKGGGLRRLTSTGRDDSPACSADGRMVAYFSRRAKEPGLYVMPVVLPARTKRVLSDLGSSLRWGRPERSADKSL